MRRAFALALVVLASVVPSIARAASVTPTTIVHRYLAAIAAQHFVDAYALLSPTQHGYFRNAANFASVFAADDAALVTFSIVGVRADGSAHVVVVRERIAFDDPAHDVHVTTDVMVPYVVTGDATQLRILEPAGRPWRAFATSATTTSGGLRVTVKKVAFDTHAIRVVVTMQNDGPGFVTVLPDGRSVLRDDVAELFHPLVTRDWTITDHQFFLGLRLAPNSRYTGVLAFATPVLDDRARRFTLSLGPIVRDGGTAPFAVDVSGVAPRG
jgi:hypothetical protein